MIIYMQIFLYFLLSITKQSIRGQKYMAIHLSKRMAQKIVDTVKDVCGYDINFINIDGIIFASTNEKRIGEFHEIGKKVIDTREIIEVDTDDSFYGTQKGVNIPFIYKHEIIAVIGISGIPDEVRQYAILAQKITCLLLKEQELDTLNYIYKNQEDSVVRSLLENKPINPEFLQEFLAKKDLSMKENYRIIIIRPDSKYNYSNIAMLESEIHKIFSQIPSCMSSGNYLSDYRLLISEKDFVSWKAQIFHWAKNYKKTLTVGIGGSESIYRQNISCSQSEIALKSLNSHQNIACYDDLVLEIITSSIPSSIVQIYREKTIQKLEPEDIALLKLYFTSEMSLQKTAEALFIHKNTVQYKLKRIEALTGYNPRKFTDAVILYMALTI